MGSIVLEKVRIGKRGCLKWNYATLEIFHCKIRLFCKCLQRLMYGAISNVPLLRFLMELERGQSLKLAHGMFELTSNLESDVTCIDLANATYYTQFLELCIVLFPSGKNPLKRILLLIRIGKELAQSPLIRSSFIVYLI